MDRRTQALAWDQIGATQMQIHDQQLKLQHEFYIHKQQQCGGWITVSVQAVGHRCGPLSVQFGMAFCSPLDSFNKKKGRMIADGRREKHPITIRVADADTIVSQIEHVINHQYTTGPDIIWWPDFAGTQPKHCCWPRWAMNNLTEWELK